MKREKREDSFPPQRSQRRDERKRDKYSRSPSSKSSRRDEKKSNRYSRSPRREVKKEKYLRFSPPRAYRVGERQRDDKRLRSPPFMSYNCRERQKNKFLHSPSSKSQMRGNEKLEKSSHTEPKDFNNKGQNEEEERQIPCFAPSGKLMEDTNLFKGVIIKYNEPPEAKMPRARWRLYPFKGEEGLPVIYIHRQSAYLIGRDRKIADFPIDHPSCSKQHAALQYRSMPFERADGTRSRRTLPYIIDLNSGNGTFLNKERIEAQRYYELKVQDVLKFGFSSREYVVLKEFDENKNDKIEDSDEDEVDLIDRAGIEAHVEDGEEN